jgi:hypothetical protein
MFDAYSEEEKSIKSPEVKNKNFKTFFRENINSLRKLHNTTEGRNIKATEYK